ncbi:MAG: acyl-CoA reductase [Sporocytophaga sp.]|nr:acyl-CoA reductase [Sporocytophaga sp.]
METGLSKRADAFASLGKYLNNLSDNELDIWARQVENNNSWFTNANVKQALNGIIALLDEKKLKQWIEGYSSAYKSRNVGVVMAGNIPAAGFHDFLCVLLTGHHFYGKLAATDNVLLRKIAALLIEIEPSFAAKISFQDMLKNMDAYIASGSDNSAKYFKAYFSKVPHLVRKNRSSVAILNGEEGEGELKLLSEDIFTYFGLGCRNVSKLFVPHGYDFDSFYKNMNKFEGILNYHKYANNYDYQKSIFLLNKVDHLDNGFLMLKRDEQIVSPISVVYYEEYENLTSLQSKLSSNQEKIQVVLSANGWYSDSVPFGKAQCPTPWDYADNVDTMKFLMEL